MVFWMLAREVLILKGQLPQGRDWDVMVDLFIARDIESIRKQQEEAKKADEENKIKDEEEKVDESKAVEG